MLFRVVLKGSAKGEGPRSLAMHTHTPRRTVALTFLEHSTYNLLTNLTKNALCVSIMCIRRLNTLRITHAYAGPKYEDNQPVQ